MNVGWLLRAVNVITMLEAVVVRYGAPEHLRSDNGPEFIPYAIQDWLEEALIKTIYTNLGSPWESSEARWPAAGSPKGEAKPRQNGQIESFHDRLRNERLSRELFGSFLEAIVILEAWRIEYNESRPHASTRPPNAGGVRAAQQLWAPYAQSCHQHQNQSKITASGTSDLSCSNYGFRLIARKP
jgi:transposase InsO family protein